MLIDLCMLLDVPGAPKDVQVDSVTDETVGLNWHAPENDGGSYITNYVIERFDADTGKWTRAATSRSAHCTVENLLPKKSYQFRILAENIFGLSEPSEPTKTVQTEGRFE